MRRAIFLDRDGTLNLDTGYVHKREDWQWLPGVLPALRQLRDAGWLLLVASNQSGIGRGYYSRDDLQHLEDWLKSDLAAHGTAIDSWYYCPHRPEDGCQCRKPLPGLLLEAARDWDVDLSASWMIGDRLRDAQAGIAAGCKAALLWNEKYREEWLKAAGYPQIRRWRNLAAAATHL